MKALTVAKYTFYESVKSKLLFNVLFVGIALILITFVTTSLSYGAPEKIALDVGLGLLSISLKVISIFYGVGIIQQEIENRSIYLVLSRPITKSQYLVGRVMGLGSMLLLNAWLLGLLSILLFLIYGGSLTALIFWTIFFLFLESLIVLLLVVVASLFCSKVIAILFSISVYVAGYVSTALLESGRFTDGLVINWILKISKFVLPNFSRLNFKDYLLYEQKIAVPEIFQSMLHAVFYMVALMLVGLVIFNEKNLE